MPEKDNSSAGLIILLGAGLIGGLWYLSQKKASASDDGFSPYDYCANLGMDYDPSTNMCIGSNGNIIPPNDTFSWYIKVYGEGAYPLPGATITITCRGLVPGECDSVRVTPCPCVKNTKYSVTTRLDGTAWFVNIPCGFYDMEISAAGYDSRLEAKKDRAIPREYSISGNPDAYYLVKTPYTSPIPVTIPIDVSIDPGLKNDRTTGVVAEYIWGYPAIFSMGSGTFTITDVCSGCIYESGAWWRFEILTDNGWIEITSEPDYTYSSWEFSYNPNAINPGTKSWGLITSMLHAKGIRIKADFISGFADFTWKLSRFTGTITITEE